MKFFFVHQNFPAQFKHLAPALVRAGHQVVALHHNACLPMPGVEFVRYAPQRGTSDQVHPWVSDWEAKVIRAEAVFHAALGLKSKGFTPDAVIAHPGWGESLFIKRVWPDTRLGIYAEFFYHAQGADVGFDAEFGSEDVMSPCRIDLKNINNVAHLEMADAAISPTHWQASTFPKTFQPKITVMHDGIDCDALQPNAQASVFINQNLRLTRADEIITFVNRNLEPYRGYHIVMRALPQLLKARPQARVIVVGGNKVSYGAPAPQGKSWRDIFWHEVRSDLDTRRVHFVGKLPYKDYLQLMQVSRVHVYMTYPFVLSWSLLEAMSMGCAIVASDTAPVREAIEHNQNGRLVPFFESAALASEVAQLCESASDRVRLGQAARAHALSHYDLKRRCLPAQLAWAQSLHTA